MSLISQRDFALQIVERLQAKGFEALWAGGCVRDQLLNREPNDYDVATNATPDEVRDLFGRKSTLAIGASFGVITVLGPKSAGQIEVATFRTDAEYSDGRHPDSVKFSTAEEDAKRRDFTINGLFFDPIQNKVIDFVGGQQDLQNNLLRAIGNPHERIAEDKLRMLRAARFAATFRLDIDPETLSAIQQRSNEISVVSQERIGAEMRKMLAHPNRSLAYNWLRETQLFQEIMPFMQSNPGGSASVQHSPELAEPMLEMLPDEADHCLALACLLSGFCDNSSDVERTCRDLKWSNKEIEKTTWIHTNVNTLGIANERPWSEIQPLLINDWSGDALILCEVAAQTIGASLAGVEFCRAKLELPESELNPEPFLNGSDLQGLKLPSGPLYKRILEKTRAAQLDGIIENKAEAIEMAKRQP